MVIQRWQSVFLIFATIVIAILPFFSIMQVSTATGVYDFSSMGITSQGIPSDGPAQGLIETSYTPVFMILNFLIVILTAITIFAFKSIKLQKQLCIINILLTIILSVALGVSFYMTMIEIKAQTYSLMTSAILPLLSIASTIMAYIRIKGDEKILKSYDRIR